MSEQGATTDELVGQILGDRYRVVERIGAGGMGTVYRGEHVAIGRPVAIKVLNPQHARSDDTVRRFEREARAAARLSHPNCVPVTDFGQLSDDTLYLVMEFVEGRSLGDLLDEEGRVPLERALRITRHVLCGLGHAHAANIVHRDIKPDNVMLVDREDQREVARVVDFGIAQLQTDDDESRITRAGMAIGTPTYLSPEQAFGGVVDHRSDLYSTTVMLFRMLAGAAPYRGPTPLAVLTGHASAPIPRVSDVAPDVVVPRAVEDLLFRGLAKEPAARFGDAASYVAAIDACLGEGGRDTPPRTAELRSQTQPPLAAHAPTEAALHTSTASMTPVPPPVAATPVMVTPMPRSPARRRGAMAIGVSIAIVTLISLFASCPSRDESYEDSVELLRQGDSCEDRRRGVRALRRLGDKRAIPALVRAQRRYRGGVLGIGSENTNKCLIEEAREAVRYLESLP